jgi:hypothetical protein
MKNTINNISFIIILIASIAIISLFTILTLVQAIQFMALFFLMLVTGIFWGPWFALHRSLDVFNGEEFIHIVKTLSANLALPMRVMMPCCIFFMLLSVGFYPEKNSCGFYLTIIALSLIVLSLIITMLVEVPIVSKINQWTTTTIPWDWEKIRDRWVRFHVLRTFASLISFASFITSILLLQ